MWKIARLALLLIIGLVLAACGRGDIFAPTPTSVLFEASPTPRATLDPVVAAAQAAERGEVIFNTMYPQAGFACVTCHSTTDARLTGPGFAGLGARAGTRVEGQSAEDYLHNSIINPNAFIVPGEPVYPPNLMPQIYAELFSEQQINDLIAYLLTL